jgi:asparagine synthase (glutamine-hydrolysing)
VKRYWDPVFVEHGSTTPESVLAERLRDTLAAAVAHRAPAEHGGAFLSGGLDSSTVAGMLVKARGAGSNTFSIGFGIEGYDELDYARIASRHFRTTPHEYSVTPEDVVDAIPRIAAAYDEPFGNSSAVPTYFCARLAKQHGVDHLLAGDGGDELFGGNERYARQKVFEAYGSLPGWLRGSVIEPVARLVPQEHPFMPLRKFRSYVDQASVPMPGRMEHWNFMYRADLDAMLEPEVRRAIEPRRALEGMRAVWASTSATALVNRMLFYDWHYTLADNDLRKVRRMCELGGIRVSFPMLDDRLLDLSLEVTPRQKVQGSNLRAFYKRALGEFLPREIIEKTKHGFGLPFGVWLKTHRPLAELVYSLLGDLKKRHIVRAPFLDQLIEDHRSGHPSFYGYAIWDLAMLEAWLSAHAAR